ncbi:MAG: hypothetical protein HQ557_08090 [Bacteroidetes bacterium]|nr:hypothetical protein [Bacteroidota bacterium]
MADGKSFDLYWRNKFCTTVEENSETPQLYTQKLKEDDSDPVNWTINAMEAVRGQSEGGAKALYEIMTRCACTYPEESLTGLRDLYRQTGSVSVVHNRLQEQFLRDIYNGPVN